MSLFSLSTGSLTSIATDSSSKPRKVITCVGCTVLSGAIGMPMSAVRFCLGLLGCRCRLYSFVWGYWDADVCCTVLSGAIGMPMSAVQFCLGPLGCRCLLYSVVWGHWDADVGCTVLSGALGMPISAVQFCLGQLGCRYLRTWIEMRSVELDQLPYPWQGAENHQVGVKCF